MQYANRELSQFASFLKVNDVSQQIAITTSVTPYIGIGLTEPQEKLDVLGNIKASGVVTATAFYGDGSTLDNVTALVDGYFVSTPSGIWTGASVGIGTSTFTQKLNVSGSVLANRFFSNAAQGTAPFSVQSTTVVPNLNSEFFNGRTAPVGNIVGDSDVQTLENKTLISPEIATISNNGATLTVPITTGTLVDTGAVGIITEGMYANGSIINNHIAVGAGISYTKLGLNNSIRSSDIDPNNRIQNNKLQNSTISGISLGSNLANLVPGDYLVGGSYNGSSEITISVAATTSNTPNTLVARDENGDISIQGVNAAGVVPIGGIIMWSGASVPVGWALCNGDVVNGNQTPDLRGRFIIGAGYGGVNPSIGGSAYLIGNTGGAHSVTLNINQIPSHNHGGSTGNDSPDHSHPILNALRRVPSSPSQQDVLDYSQLSTSGANTGGATARHTHSITSQGGSQSHENRPAYYALAYIMRIS